MKIYSENKKSQLIKTMEAIFNSLHTEKTELAVHCQDIERVCDTLRKEDNVKAFKVYPMAAKEEPVFGYRVVVKYYPV